MLVHKEFFVHQHAELKLLCRLPFRAEMYAHHCGRSMVMRHACILCSNPVYCVRNNVLCYMTNGLSMILDAAMLIFIVK